MAGERIRMRIGSLANAVLITGQAYQDPKDALNEFVSNAADEYAETERPGERIRITLRRKGKHPLIIVSDDGRGMTPERLREVARNLFKSIKADDPRTMGEKAASSPTSSSAFAATSTAGRRAPRTPTSCASSAGRPRRSSRGPSGTGVVTPQAPASTSPTSTPRRSGC